MVYPGKNHKQYATPKRRFEKTRLEDEKRLIIDYGLRNKRELWKAQSVLRKYRAAARELVALRSGGLSTECSSDLSAPRTTRRRETNLSTTCTATVSSARTPTSVMFLR